MTRESQCLRLTLCPSGLFRLSKHRLSWRLGFWETNPLCVLQHIPAHPQVDLALTLPAVTFRLTLRKWLCSTSQVHQRRLAILGQWSLKMHSNQLLYPDSTSVLLYDQPHLSLLWEASRSARMLEILRTLAKVLEMYLAVSPSLPCILQAAPCVGFRDWAGCLGYWELSPFMLGVWCALLGFVVDLIPLTFIWWLKIQDDQFQSVRTFR